MRATLLVLPVVLALTLGGCPQLNSLLGTGNSRVNAVIGTSATTGDPPLMIVFTAADSSSSYFGALRYAWDFADGTTSSEVEVTHTFANPGLYRVKLTVTDAGDASATNIVEIRVRGQSAVAVISTDRSSGPAPLTVQFDGTKSVVGTDTVRDYLWDFGDGTTSVQSKPQHTFYFAKTYTVSLKITTAGGVTASTTTQITAGAATDSSLQFNGTTLATLPLPNSPTLNAFTFEAWVKSAAAGGAVLTAGSGFVLTVLPSANLVRVQLDGATKDFAANGLTDTWRHIAVSSPAPAVGSDPNTPASATYTVYVDGVSIGTGTRTTSFSISSIVIGDGYQGELSEVRAWSVARGASDIASGRLQRLAGSGSGRIGIWPLNDGSGQSLSNVAGTLDGYLGSTNNASSDDPQWVVDTPF